MLPPELESIAAELTIRFRDFVAGDTSMTGLPNVLEAEEAVVAWRCSACGARDLMESQRLVQRVGYDDADPEVASTPAGLKVVVRRPSEPPRWLTSWCRRATRRAAYLSRRHAEPPGLRLMPRVHAAERPAAR